MLRALLAAALFALAASAANADVLVHIDKSTQKMTVSVDGQTRYVWPVSTGIAQYDTPDGEFRAFRMEKDHFSKEWDDAPMPYSIFFTKQGHAIHGTYHTSIGRPASHGCVRLSVANAAKLWELVSAQGVSKTKVVLTGEIPGSNAVARAPRYRQETTGSAVSEAGGNRYYRYYGNDGYAAPQPPQGYVYRQPYQQQYQYSQPAPFPFWFGGR
jgi:hypothetical protein